MFGASELTDYNTVAQGAGLVGYSADLELNSSEQLYVADNAALSVGGNAYKAWAGWIKIESFSGLWMTVVGKWDSSNAESEIAINPTTHQVQLTVRDPANTANANAIATSQGALNAGEWYFVYAYHDEHEDEIGISVNNGPVNTLAYADGVRNGTSYLRLGSVGASQYFDGELDEWAVWDRTLTPQELDYLYNGGQGRGYPFGEPAVEAEAPAPSWEAHAYAYDANHPHAVAGVTRLENTINEYSDLYTYDANGNMVTRIEQGVEWTQTFNAENRLSSLSDGTDTWSFVYDGDGNRVRQVNPDGSVTIFLFGGLYSAEVVSGSVAKETKYYAIAGQRVAWRTGLQQPFCIVEPSPFALNGWRKPC